MRAEEEHRAVFVEDVLRPIPMMDIPIDDEHALDPMCPLRVASSERDVVHDAKTHAAVGRGSGSGSTIWTGAYWTGAYGESTPPSGNGPLTSRTMARMPAPFGARAHRGTQADLAAKFRSTEPRQHRRRRSYRAFRNEGGRSGEGLGSWDRRGASGAAQTMPGRVRHATVLPRCRRPNLLQKGGTQAEVNNPSFFFVITSVCSSGPPRLRFSMVVNEIPKICGRAVCA